jgi:hypothetical protein
MFLVQVSFEDKEKELFEMVRITFFNLSWCWFYFSGILLSMLVVYDICLPLILTGVSVLM